MKKNTPKTSPRLQRNITFETLKREGGYFKLDSGGAANANQGTAEIIRTDDGSKQASENGSNMAELQAIKEGSYSGCTVEEPPTMKFVAVSGENEKRSRKITLDLSQKAEKGITSGKMKREENMATSGKILEIKRAQGSMECLPSDIVQDIVSRVPAETVLECKFVCKRWGTLIRGSHFTNMHLSRQLDLLHGGDNGNGNLDAKVEPCLLFACRLDDPDVFKTLLFHGGQVSHRISNDEKYIYNQNLKRIYHPPMHDNYLWNHLVGSCNGLVCAYQPHHLVIDPIYICNPLTREYLYLPELVVKKEDVDPDRFRIEGGEVYMYNDTACGYGYLRSTNEYKVVRIQYLDYDGGNVEVYTLGSGRGWRAIGKVPYRLNTSRRGMGTYANDVIYWTAINTVVAFDLAKEEFRMLSVPLSMQNRRRDDRCGLVALGRHLCLYVDDKLHIEIWYLRENSESKETWCKEFDIDYIPVVGSKKGNFRPILLTKNGEIIFLFDESVLYCYDTRTSNLKLISNEASDDYFEDVEAIAHVSTFASLEAMGEPSKRYTVRTPWYDVSGDLDLGEKIDTTRFSLVE